jgi:chitodextrinase
MLGISRRTRSAAPLAHRLWLANSALLMLAACGGTPSGEGRPNAARSSELTTPSFVQVASAVPQSAQTSVTVKYANAQTHGNLNVVVVGWNDATAAVSTVTDSAGNSYARAVGPTAYPGTLSQSIYYAANIAAAAAGANSVTVKFGTAAQNPDIRILEYGGLATSGVLDVAAAASGSSGTSDSGALTTTGANELLVAANMVSDVTNGPGTGFTQRVLTQPDSDLVEDEVAAAAGTYHGTAAVSGVWVMQMVAFRTSTVQPPTAPAGLTASAAGSAQINLAWTASTSSVGIAGYRVERCQGAGCSNFAQVATPTSTTYADSALAANTSYSYRVRAADTAGTLSAYSNTASATTAPDTQPPSAPSALAATAVSGTHVSLSWTASTDNVGVTDYLVERCQGAGCSSFAQVGTSASTAFNDTGLAAATAYSYRVRATDAAGNLSAYSNVASVTTPSPDTQPPTAPSGLSATAISAVQLNLSWTASTDNVGVTGYLVERCEGAGCSSFAQVAAPAGTSTTYTDNGLLVGTSYSYRLRATDAAGNLSGYSNTASATTLTTAPNPVTPTFLQANSTSPAASLATVSVKYTLAENAGDFNVVVVGWNDTSANVTSVTDSKGNSYSRAVGPTALSGVFSQSIYYATNIAAAAAGSNTVTVNFSPSAVNPDLRILEYQGIAHSGPVDVTTAATGTSTTSSTGSVNITNAGDLLIGANLVTFLTAGPGPGYVQRSLTAPDGDIVEDRVVITPGSYSASAPLQISCGWLMQLVAFKAAPPDATPPNVAVTSPAGGASLSGVVTVNVTANDPDSGLLSIQLLVDGNAVGTIATTSPASFSLDTTQFPNGSHSVSASAMNGGRGVGFATPVAVTFTNASPGNPAVSGLWSGLIPIPVVAVHVSQLPGTSILMGDGQSFGFDTRTWDTATNAINSVPVPVNTFCSGHDQMADGRVFFGGGENGTDHVGLTTGNAFDPVTQTWAVLADMVHPRWYPSATTLPDGRELMLSGESTCTNCDVSVAEIYSPASNTWTQLTSAPFTFPYYPHVFVLPDGRVLVSSVGQAPVVSQILDLTKLTWTAVGGVAVDGGSAAMYRPGKILKTGTSVDPETATVPSVATAYVLDTTQSSPTWRQVASMNHTRTFHTLTLLPDGNVLVTGGGTTTAATDTAHAVLPAEIWSATAESWTSLASMHAPRLYHSNAILMPDARVLILGGGRLDDNTLPTDQFSAEFFSPPYLFKGPRPVIASAPSTIAHGQVFTVQTPDASRIASVSLMRFTAVTHAINMGQRYVPLAFTAGSGSLSVTGPVNANLATPGNYMLFLVDTNGIPSVAAQVRL